MEHLKRHFNREFSSEEVLELVGRFYNIEMLKDDEETDMLNHEEDFSLPQSYFPKVQSWATNFVLHSILFNFFLKLEIDLEL